MKTLAFLIVFVLYPMRRNKFFLENGYIFCVFLLYPLRDIFKKVAPFVYSRALPIEVVVAKHAMPTKYFSKMPVQKCDFWTLGEGDDFFFKKYW